ncbi:MAG: tetratricopeptide repeat protein, partial [Candidatus Riflebacteria bacterium]|nr:tetratricopeptide repeat protein [Candidatus Riflebacteria bacterium]
MAHAKVRTDARRNLSLRLALDKARDALLHRNLARARGAILKAGEQGPLAVRPTRLLWEIVQRWLRAVGSGEGGPMDPLFTSKDAYAAIDCGHEQRKRGRLEQALGCYRKALTHCPLSPEAIQ